MFIMCSAKRSTAIYETSVNDCTPIYYKRKKVFHLVFHSIQYILPAIASHLFCPFLRDRTTAEAAL